MASLCFKDYTPKLEDKVDYNDGDLHVVHYGQHLSLMGRMMMMMMTVMKSAMKMMVSCTLDRVVGTSKFQID